MTRFFIPFDEKNFDFCLALRYNDVVKIKKKEKKKSAIILHKPSGTIAIAGEVTLVQRRLYNIFLHTAQEMWDKQEKTDEGVFFSLPIPAIQKKYKIPITNRKWLIEAIKTLVTTYAHYNILGKDPKIEKDRIFSLLTEVRITVTDGVVKSVKFMFPPSIYKTIEGVIKGQRPYANLDLDVSLTLKTKYSENLYEICKDYENIVEKELSIGEFRKLFGIENKYKKIVDVKRWVLDPAVKELNSNPLVNFTVSYKLIKNGQKYTRVKFIINPKPQKLKIEQQVEDYKSLAEDPDLRELLFLLPESYRKRKNCISLLSGALEKKNKEYVQAQIKYVNEKNPKNYCGYLKKAIEKDYAGAEEIEIDFGEEEDWRKKVVGKIVNDKKTGESWKVIKIDDETDNDGYYAVRLDRLSDGNVRWMKWTEDELKKIAEIKDKK